MSKANKSAFPIIRPDNLVGSVMDSSGLTKRELFAAMAMQGLLANTNIIAKDPHNGAICNYASSALGEFAVERADALLTELAKRED